MPFDRPLDGNPEFDASVRFQGTRIGFEDFVLLYQSGVSASEIAAYFSCPLDIAVVESVIEYCERNPIAVAAYMNRVAQQSEDRRRTVNTLENSPVMERLKKAKLDCLLQAKRDEISITGVIDRQMFESRSLFF